MIVTDWIILSTIMSIAISDLILIWNRMPSYSRRLAFWGSRVSFFPYAWGVLGGHFWSPIEAPAQMAWWGTLLTLVGIGLAVSIVHYTLRHFGKSNYRWLPLCVYLPGGVSIGAAFWGLGAAAG